MACGFLTQMVFQTYLQILKTLKFFKDNNTQPLKQSDGNGGREKNLTKRIPCTYL